MIIIPVLEYTEWTNTIDPVRKGGMSLRLCLDQKDLKNIERNQYYTMNIDELSRTPWVQVLYSDGCQVKLLNGLTRQRKLITDNVQHALGKVQMVITTFWSVCQLRCLLGEAGCSHQDSVRGYWHSR